MRLIAIVLFVICGSIFPSYAGEAVNDDETLQNFAEVIREKGFDCNQCTQADVEMRRVKNKTTVISSVVCDDGRNSYTVTLKPNGKMIVENTTF